MTTYELIEFLKTVPADYTVKVVRDMEASDIFPEDLKYSVRNTDKEIVLWLCFIKAPFNLLVEIMTVHLLGNRDSRFNMLQVLSKF